MCNIKTTEIVGISVSGKLVATPCSKRVAVNTSEAMVGTYKLLLNNIAKTSGRMLVAHQDHGFSYVYSNTKKIFGRPMLWPTK